MTQKRREAIYGKLNEFSRKEGWVLFDCDNKSVIQRIDDDEVFPDDSAAIEFVISRAISGSRLHAIMLLMHETPNKFDGNSPDFYEELLDALPELQ